MGALLNRTVGHGRCCPERPDAGAEMRFVPISTDRCGHRRVGRSNPRQSLHGRPGTQQAEDQLPTRLTLMDLMQLLAMRRTRRDVEVRFVEAVGAGLVHRVLRICCIRNAIPVRSGPEWAVDLEWS